MDVRKLEVMEASMGFFIGYPKDGKIVRVSMYYESEDTAKDELHTGAWERRVADRRKKDE